MSRCAGRRCRADTMTSVAGGEQRCQQPLCCQGHVQGMPVCVAPANPESCGIYLPGCVLMCL